MLRRVAHFVPTHTGHSSGSDSLVSRELVPSVNLEKFIEISPVTLLIQPYKFLLPPQKKFIWSSFFSYFHFHHTLLVGLLEPGTLFSKSLFVHSLVCLITYSFLNGFQSNLNQHFSICSTSEVIFSLE